MYTAALRGDWQLAEKLLRETPELANAKITRTGDSAREIALALKHKNFARELVNWTTRHSELTPQNDSGFTGFSNEGISMLATIASLINRDPNETTPFHVAILAENRHILSRLQQHIHTGDLSQEQTVVFEFFVDAIRKRMYDVALELFDKNANLATMADGEETALHVLAQHDMSDIGACLEAILKSFATISAALPCLPWLRKIFRQPLMRKNARLLAKKLLAEILGLEDEAKMLRLINSPRILHDAVKAGNVEFLTMVTCMEPDLIWDIDENQYTIFHVAVLERQENVFRLIRQVGSLKYHIAAYVDKEGNNILHLAGKLPMDRRRLSIVSGAALQMQRELMWFKEMEKILPPSCLKVKNETGLRPRELFTKEHENLMKEGEIWMRDTADSFMLIATIMLTVAFTAGFTVPGGNNSETGIPVLLKSFWFKVFLASDAVAMFCATFSIMMFLSILTSRFREDDFLKPLPRKLLFGILGLFGSLIGTISAFTSAYFLIFSVERAWLTTLFGFAAGALLTLIFLIQHYDLIFDTFCSIYLSKYMFRCGRHRLF